MSTGAVFQLVTNDGKQDKMLMASNLLHKRLLTISSVRESRNLDPTPTLADIERTHILFVNAHFKPFVAMAYEYNKVIAPGTHSLGQKVDFNIPQFGDFFSDMVLNARMTMSSNTYTAFLSGSGVEKGSWSDLVTAGAKWRWCNYPGERLIQLAEFSVNGNPLDSYTPYATNVWREFYVQPNKRRGWDRCMGQQLEETAYINSRTTNSNLATLTTNDPSYTQNQIGSTGCQLLVSCTDGLQTPSYSHEKVVDLWIPLLFWFNTDFRLSIPSVAIPYGQRFISLTLANANKLVGFPVEFGSNTLVGSNTCDFSKDNNSVKVSNAWTNTKLDIELTLYINNLFVNPEIHEIFIRRISFNLIRVHKEQSFSITKAQDSLWLNSLKWPIETLYIGMRSVDVNTNDEACQIINLDQWNTFTYNQYCQCISPIQTHPYDGTGGTDSVNVGTQGDEVDLFPTGQFEVPIGLQLVAPDADATNASIQGLVALQAVKLDKKPILKNVSVSAHGIKFYDNFPADFFNKYTPYRYGGPNVTTPEDKGLLMINFCLYPHSYQPSGHINVSRAREFYLDYDLTDLVSNEINSGASAENGKAYQLKILASAINFLLISDGSAVLRYST